MVLKDDLFYYENQQVEAFVHSDVGVTASPQFFMFTGLPEWERAEGCRFAGLIILPRAGYRGIGALVMRRTDLC